MIKTEQMQKGIESYARQWPDQKFYLIILNQSVSPLEKYTDLHINIPTVTSGRSQESL